MWSPTVMSPAYTKCTWRCKDIGQEFDLNPAGLHLRRSHLIHDRDQILYLRFRERLQHLLRHQALKALIEFIVVAAVETKCSFLKACGESLNQRLPPAP
jgi:hypothetical protein